jgi:protein-disulfide isomerase
MRLRIPILAAVLIALGAWSLPAAAQEPTNAELKKQMDALQESLKTMQKDLQDIKTLLQTRQQPAGPKDAVVLDIANNPTRGDKAAKITLVEFTDYQCPFCARYVRDTYPQIDKEYIQTGKVKYVLLDLPLESIHKSALKAAEAAHCAGDQGKYWEMHDRLFENQKALEPWTPHAEAIGLDVAKFETCMTSGKWTADVKKDAAQAQALGISGTPGYYLGATDPTGTKVKTVKFMRGAQPFDNFKAEIDKLLEPAKPAGSQD